MRFKALGFAVAMAALVGGVAVCGNGLIAPAFARTAPARVAPAHERLLPLEGGRNFRDLGGYATTDGHHVKWGLLFRSGSMHGLTANDHAYLEKLGLRVVCDFRSPAERKAEPAVWPKANGPEVFADDYELKDSLPKGDMSHMNFEQARDTLASMYPVMLVKFNDQYRRMFAQLLAGHAPLAFNCSAGKDRTGIAAALLLTALGVPRQTVVADYLLTNTYLKPAQLLGKDSKATADSDWAKSSNPVMRAFLTADPSYIQAALAVIDAHAGGADGYLRDELGLSGADIRKLRAMYLQ